MWTSAARPISRLLFNSLFLGGSLLLGTRMAQGACDPCFPWRNHGEYVRCVAHEAQAMVDQALLTEDEGSHLVSQAAQSDIGKRGFVPSGCELPACRSGVFNDNFNDGSSASWLPRLQYQGFWSEANGTMNFQGSAGGEQHALLIQTTALALSDYDVSYRSRPLDTSEITLRLGGFAFRYVDDLNYIAVAPLLHNTDYVMQFYLYKVKNGVKTQIGGGFCETTGDLVTNVCDWGRAFNPLSITNWRSVDITARGNRYTLAIEGTTILDFTDTGNDFTAGAGFGLMFLSGGGTYSLDLQWDDLTLVGCTSQ